MRVPLEIQGEWASLAKTDDVESNLRSIAAIRGVA